MISYRGISVITSPRGRGRYLSCSLFILFSQNYTEEQISQRCTETLSQPKAQSVTAIVGCWVIDVRCWWLAIGVSRWSRPLGRWAAISHVLSLFFFSQDYTEEKISQRCTETLSQPIAQNVTAIVGCWVIDVRCWWLAIGVSRWSRPFGGGAAISHVLPLFFSHRTTQKNKFHKGAQRH